MESILQNDFSSSQILTYIQQATERQSVSPEGKEVVYKQEMSEEIKMEPEEVIASSANKLSKIDILTRNMLPGESSLKVLDVNSRKKIFNCDICNHKFHWYPDLRQHAKVHRGQKPFQCAICGIILPKKGDLINHLKTHKSHFQQIFPCDVCKKEFKQKFVLILHKNNRPAVGSFVCQGCGKSFF